MDILFRNNPQYQRSLPQKDSFVFVYFHYLGCNFAPIPENNFFLKKN